VRRETVTVIRHRSPPITNIPLIILVITVLNWALFPNSLKVQASSYEGAYLLVVPPVHVAKGLGEVFAVNINISNVQNLKVFEFKLGYNTTLLDPMQVVLGPFFPPPPKATIERLETNETMGFVLVRISLSGLEPPRNGSGTLAVITFNVTLAPTSCEGACCVLDLHDTLLYDNTMTTITHDSVDGLYFWKSIQEDPPVEGRLLDLTTQKDGTGQGVPGGNFTLGEIVELSALLTYNGNPVQEKLVSFTVLNPKNETILVGVAITNHEGFASTDFRIPSISESIGTWKAVASAEVAEKGVWDFLNFSVAYLVPPYGPKAHFTETPQSPYVNETVKFDASNSSPGWNGTHQMPIVEYRWDFGDSSKTTVSVPIIYHTYESAGVYTVTLTVYAPGANPETDNATHLKTVRKIPPYVGGHIVLVPARLATHKAEPSAPIMAAIITLVVVTIVLARKLTTTFFSV